MRMNFGKKAERVRNSRTGLVGTGNTLVLPVRGLMIYSWLYSSHLYNQEFKFVSPSESWALICQIQLCVKTFITYRTTR